MVALSSPKPCYTLSRLKGIETKPQRLGSTEGVPTCYTLSRLKGIETPMKTAPKKKWMPTSCYTLSRLKGIETCSATTQRPNALISCYTLSRLKGIET